MADQKLEWMYRNSNEVVDREEYLLGKPIDRAFEQSSTGNDIEKDCLPTSIFANSSSNIQVDVVRKLKEDPLEVIRQQEIERRKQLLKNPVKLKKLQNMLKEKQSHEKKEGERKKKKLGISSGDESQDIDSLLTSRYLSLMKKHGIKSLSELSSLKLHKKKKKRKKTHSESSDSDSEETHKKNKKHSKIKKNDFSESDNEDLHVKSKGHKTMRTSYSSKRDGSSASDSEVKKKYKQQNDSKRSESKKDFSDSDSDLVDKKKLKNPKHVKTAKNKCYSYESSDNNSESQKETYKNYKSSIRGRSFSPDKARNCKKQIGNCDSSNIDKNKIYGLNLTKMSNKESQTMIRKRRSRSKSPTKNKYINDSSRLKNHPGRSDSKKKEYREYKVNNQSYGEKKSKGLSEEEKQKKLEEMMSNAKWRDDFRIKNVSKYKKEDTSENKEYNEDFIRKQMQLATSSGSVEARIKSNINNIQRSKFSMSENFVRR